MLAARLPGILPELSPAEALETSMVHSHAEMSQVSFCDVGSHTPKGEASAVVVGRVAAPARDKLRDMRKLLKRT